jgi:hypothetical protein
VSTRFAHTSSTATSQTRTRCSKARRQRPELHRELTQQQFAPFRTPSSRPAAPFGALSFQGALGADAPTRDRECDRRDRTGSGRSDRTDRATFAKLMICAGARLVLPARMRGQLLAIVFCSVRRHAAKAA